ncbi:uncharacterized protein LOC107764390 isoform X5 [Nicotiana tabacum]|uniref:Uncharacterized protein LOC107764390 isoform X5 n=1 Tax=Nicotiana tabacum TaxID=4097 RepID=A0AC58T4N2_TOBAC
MSEEGKDSHHHHHGHHHHHHHHEDDQPPPPPPPPAEYGTFQAPPQPVVGFPQPVPPPGAFEPSPEYYARAYQVVPGSLLVSFLLPSLGMLLHLSCSAPDQLIIERNQDMLHAPLLRPIRSWFIT